MLVDGRLSLLGPTLFFSLTRSAAADDVREFLIGQRRFGGERKLDAGRRVFVGRDREAVRDAHSGFFFNGSRGIPEQTGSKSRRAGCLVQDLGLCLGDCRHGGSSLGSFRVRNNWAHYYHNNVAFLNWCPAMAFRGALLGIGAGGVAAGVQRLQDAGVEGK